MSKKRLCIVCDINPATHPDREQMGRSIKRLCVSCYGDRLRGDLRRVVAAMPSREVVERGLGAVLADAAIATLDGNTYHDCRCHCGRAAMSEDERAVVEAAEALWATMMDGASVGYLNERRAFHAAVTALRKSREAKRG